SNTRMSRSRIRHFPFCEELHILRQLPTFHDKQVALGRSMETAMDLDSLRPPSSARAGTCHDEAAQELEDWATTIAVIVACTPEPSCALAYCFGNHQFFSQRRPGPKSDVT